MVVLEKEKYNLQREYIRNWITTKPDNDIREDISMIAIVTYCPIIVVMEFVMEIKGFTPELMAIQERLMKFYHIDKVV